MPGYITPGGHRLLDRLLKTPVAAFDAAWTLLLANSMYATPMGEWHGREHNGVWRTFLGSGGRVRHTPQFRCARETAVVGALRATAPGTRMASNCVVRWKSCGQTATGSPNCGMWAPRVGTMPRARPSITRRWAP